MNLTPGNRYRAKPSFMSGPRTFIADEIRVFQQDGYLPYDNSFVYQFDSENDGQELRATRE